MLKTETADEDTAALAASSAVSSDSNTEEYPEDEKLAMSREEKVNDIETSCVVTVPGVLVGAGVGEEVGDVVVGAIVGADVGL
eukprot:1514117-Pyramimonas_sp.AAC.2